ncbi:hypothetical protein GOC59_11630 [Sinorhizobium medicae]|nr:hypothetical protein [Sinorhizobium medicae]MDX0540235.1 hypothetical protein [Sinorhizobium medicae]MDX1148419.1 hypothetical protein [Sinorhizobium medicae]
MKSRKKVPTPITREGIVAELRTLADLAEANGDRFAAVRALKCAWRIENQCPVNPIPPSLDRMLVLSEASVPLVRGFAPENAERLEADIAELRRCQVELALLESKIATIC